MRTCTICGLRPAEKTGMIYKGKQYFTRKCYRCRVAKPGRRSMEERFWEKVEKTDNCWNWLGGKDKHGYGRIGLTASRNKEAHRYSWELHFGKIQDGRQINHHCDNPSCVRPDHLYAGTHADNMRDMKERGRSRNRYSKESTCL